jgi:hypothetical protein
VHSKIHLEILAILRGFFIRDRFDAVSIFVERAVVGILVVNELEGTLKESVMA